MYVLLISRHICRFALNVVGISFAFRTLSLVFVPRRYAHWHIIVHILFAYMLLYFKLRFIVSLCIYCFF